MAWRYTVRQLVLALVLLQVALGVRVAAARWWEARLPPGQKFAFGDSEGYWELARTVAKGQPYQYGEYRVFRTPGYPVLLAPLFWLAGDDEPPVLWGRVEGAFFGTIAVALVGLLAWKLFDERTAWIAGLIATFYPGQIASSIFVLSEAPFIPLMLGQLLAWVHAAQTPSSRWRLGYSLIAGLLMGLAVLVRPSWLLFLPFAGGLAIIFSRERWKHLQIAAAMLLALCITMSPWWVRNYQVTGRFVPTSLQVGISLADGWNPAADGASNLSRMNDIVVEETGVHTKSWGEWRGDSHFLFIKVSPTFEAAVDERLRDYAFAWAKQNPLRVLQLAGIKFLRMWNFVPNASEFGSLKFRILYALTYTPLLICCALGLWKFRARGFTTLLLFLPAIYFTLLHVIFVSSIRYQQPAIMVWLVLAAAWIAGKIRNPKHEIRKKSEIQKSE